MPLAVNVLRKNLKVGWGQELPLVFLAKPQSTRQKLVFNPSACQMVNKYNLGKIDTMYISIYSGISQ